MSRNLHDNTAAPGERGRSHPCRGRARRSSTKR
uniref:DIE2/ALG10 family n=1 Tax=Arundo donax TaxID=35708 RepID=A0A0A9AIQ2_ARUDO